MPRPERQSQLFGGSPPQAGPPHRLFFALWPESVLRDGARDATAALVNAHAAAGRQVRPDRYHLTLQFLGDIPGEEREGVVARAMAAADTVRVPAFDLVLDRAGGFPGARVWWLGASEVPDGLRGLWDALEAALRAAGQKAKASPGFSPHLTVVRDVHARLAPTPVAPLHWPVREFVLVDSQPPKPYRIVGRWPLASTLQPEQTPA